MQSQVDAHRFWSTSSFGEAADTSPMELAVLGEHLDACKGARGRLHTLRCVGEALRAFMASRIVTTVALVAVMIGLGSLLF